MIFDTSSHYDDTVLTCRVKELYNKDKIAKPKLDRMDITVKDGVCHIRNGKPYPVAHGPADLFRLRPLKDNLKSIDIDRLYIPQDFVDRLGMLPIKAKKTIISQGDMACSHDYIHRQENLVLDTDLLDANATEFHTHFINCNIKCNTLRFHKCKPLVFKNCNLEIQNAELICMALYDDKLKWRSHIINSFHTSGDFIHVLDCMFPIDIHEITIKFYESGPNCTMGKLWQKFVITDSMPEIYVCDFVAGSKHWYLI